MWPFGSKKKIKDSFKKRDIRLNELDKKIEKLQEQIVSRHEINKIWDLVLGKPQSQSQSQGSLRQSQSKFETKVLKKVRLSKKAITMAEIHSLAPSSSVLDMFEEIVKKKELCSKASFYRYIKDYQSQNESQKSQKIETTQKEKDR